MSGHEIIVSAKNGRKLLLNGQIYYRRNTKRKTILEVRTEG